MTHRPVPPFRAHGVLAGVVATPLVLSGCSSEQAAPFGKTLFALMAVALVVIPILFYRTWRAGPAESNDSDTSR